LRDARERFIAVAGAMHIIGVGKSMVTQTEMIVQGTGLAMLRGAIENI